MISAGYVHNPSSEVATGRVNEVLLQKASELTGGQFLQSADEKPDLSGVEVARYVEVWPYVLLAFLFLFLVDVAIRRWEHVRGLVDQIRRVVVPG
jgi:hypothetical protein